MESHDSTLSYLFTVSNDSLLFDYNNAAGVLNLWAQEKFEGSVKLYVTVMDDSGSAAMDSTDVWVVQSAVGLRENEKIFQPKLFQLKQNYPNPFNPATVVSYQLPTASSIEVTVYNTLGQNVRTLVKGRKEAGLHSIMFNANGLPSGVYYYRLSTKNGFVQIRKMVLIQ